MAPRMPQELRDLITLSRLATRVVDAVFVRVWAEVEMIMEPYRGRPLTQQDRREIMRQVDRVIGRVYGATQQAAMVSELFTTIVRVTDVASETGFVRAIDRVRKVVDRRDPSWWQRIRRQAPGKSNDPFLKMVSQFDGPIVDRQRLLRAGRLDPQRRWVPKERWNTKTGYRLSDRVWKQGQDARRAIDARIIEGISRGEDALSIARDLEQYLNPGQQPMVIRKDGKVIRRTPNHRLVVGSKSTPVNMTRYPGRGGFGSYPARRLAITEVHRVLNQATIEAGKVTPGATGIRWALANTHARQDNCDNHATNHSTGMGPGEYTFDEFPPMPDHPLCRCHSQILTVSRDEMIDMLIAKYGA